MKNFKKSLVSLSAALALVLPLGMGAVAHAAQTNCIGDVAQNECVQTSPLYCTDPSVEVFNPTSDGCDLAIDKQVSINGGAYTEADTSADAAQAQVGDTVTWKITVTNDSDGLVPTGNLTVSDVLPSGVTYNSYVASAGSYSSGVWSFNLSGSLPAILTITTHANATGLYENVAAFATYAPCLDGCSTPGAYTDSNPDNNSNAAWVDPSAKPQVLGTSTTLPDTGGGVAPSMLAGGLIAATLAVAVLGRRQSKES